MMKPKRRPDPPLFETIPLQPLRAFVLVCFVDVVAFAVGAGPWLLKLFVEGLPLTAQVPKFVIRNESVFERIYYSRFLPSTLVVADFCALAIMLLIERRGGAAAYRAGSIILEIMLLVLGIPQVLLMTGGI